MKIPQHAFLFIDRLYFCILSTLVIHFHDMMMGKWYVWRKRETVHWHMHLGNMHISKRNENANHLKTIFFLLLDFMLILTTFYTLFVLYWIESTYYAEILFFDSFLLFKAYLFSWFLMPLAHHRQEQHRDHHLAAVDWLDPSSKEFSLFLLPDRWQYDEDPWWVTRRNFLGRLTGESPHLPNLSSFCLLNVGKLREICWAFYTRIYFNILRLGFSSWRVVAVKYLPPIDFD